MAGWAAGVTEAQATAAMLGVAFFSTVDQQGPQRRQGRGQVQVFTESVTIPFTNLLDHQKQAEFDVPRGWP